MHFFVLAFSRTEITPAGHETIAPVFGRHKGFEDCVVWPVACMRAVQADKALRRREGLSSAWVLHTWRVFCAAAVAVRLARHVVHESESTASTVSLSAHRKGVAFMTLGSPRCGEGERVPGRREGQCPNIRCMGGGPFHGPP